MPGLTGITEVAADRASVVSTVVDNTCNNIGTVISQSPAAGTVLVGGSAVSITVGVRPSHPCP